MTELDDTEIVLARFDQGARAARRAPLRSVSAGACLPSVMLVLAASTVPAVLDGAALAAKFVTAGP